MAGGGRLGMARYGAHHTLICPQIPLLINLPILESTATHGAMAVDSDLS